MRLGCFLVFIISCSSIPVIEDPRGLLNNFSLEGSGRGRIVGERRGSFSFQSFFDQDDFIIVISIPFRGEEIIRITPDEIVLPTNYELDKKYQKVLIDFIDLIKTKKYTCDVQNNCVYKNTNFNLVGTPKGAVVQTSDVYALVTRNSVEIDTTPLKITLVFYEK